MSGPNTGANARDGAFAQRGAQLAAKEINEAGGITGKKIELVPGDSQCAPCPRGLGDPPPNLAGIGST